MRKQYRVHLKRKNKTTVYLKTECLDNMDSAVIISSVSKAVHKTDDS